MSKELKKLLIDYDISRNWLAEEVKTSPATISQILNHSIWPKKNAKQLRVAIEAALLSCNVPHHKITAAFCPAVAPTTPEKKEEDPMLLSKKSLTPAAKELFNLYDNPFTSELQSSEQLYLHPDIRHVRETMYHAAKNQGFVAVVGESGSGKTTLREDLHDRIEREKLGIIIIEPYMLAAEDNDVKGKTIKSSHIAEAVLRAILPTAKPFRSPEARFDQIHRALKDSARAGNKHVIIIEEAHSLPIPTLKHLKRFKELKSGFSSLIGIILIGQPELAFKLSENNPEVREVVQRCEVVTLHPLTNVALKDYLKHRAKFSHVDLSKLITDDAIQAIATRLTTITERRGQQRSLLYPLAIGNFITAAMNMAAHLGETIVNADVVKEV